ncbi:MULTISPECIES: glycogen/starch/alpha-glucan phosphorylase [unclassified Thioalkalivibrio]|uniref:glycogen/starch/alpha-glucan phosphorylase n=1 Tax=unclassified Thioalkalivibrio TaxID=2621013 RepID=UPI000195A4A6|nr:MULTISPECIES: glycogen/starch/alpha-glucan phosphorylase [unclassified Thioalkalivibrio]ADC70692.1 glycogen/starch/alpha-glucan phosphorylase [Thioalkalivibrio sp. K90mix]
MAAPEVTHLPHLPNDVEGLRQSIRDAVVRVVGEDPRKATHRDWLEALAFAIRERMVERRLLTRRQFAEEDVKRVYYLSMEYLIGRMLEANLRNMGILDEARQAMSDLGVDLDQIVDLEDDAALGNGGLGRLAACILESLATQGYPGYGYGIRYEYGMFRQEFEPYRQVEHPDNWLRYGNPWEFPRSDRKYSIHFYGYVVEHHHPNGETRYTWEDGEEVLAMAYDYPTAGYGRRNVNNLRLWAAKATRDFDLRYFNEGDYIRAVADKNESETISMVLYPNDATAIGKELRLKQEYFFVSASLQDALERHLGLGYPLDALPDKAAIQLNDTHPAIAVAELMRLLVDHHEVPWDRAWDLTRRTFAYTNHTLMPEALETWSVPLMQHVLPRHMGIIYQINHEFLEEVRHRYPGDNDRLARLSIIDEEGERRVRMAHLAVVGSHHINGVAALHTRLLQETLFEEFFELWPERFVNVTNGVTPRLWMIQSNPALTELLGRRIGNDWQYDLERLRALEPYATDPELQREFMAVKRANKARLADLVRERTGVELNPDVLFDVQVKRIHEYKRQLLKLLHVVDLYRRIRAGEDIPPRVVLFGGKAAPGYARAKAIIQVINEVADIVNHDPAVGDRLKCVFFPNYEVSSASIIIPAADISEQISTAGFEASGTGNMKLALNGALTIGTLDGANIEIRDAVGDENVFIFGMTAEEVVEHRARGERPSAILERTPDLAAAVDMIESGFFTCNDPDTHRELGRYLREDDPFFVLADYSAYAEACERADALYADPSAWAEAAIHNVARMGFFSIDRTVRDYASQIWDVTPEPVAPSKTNGAA